MSDKSRYIRQYIDRLERKWARRAERRILRSYISTAKGKSLDNHGLWLGVERRRWWIFHETDRSFRKRLISIVRGVNEYDKG